LDKDAMNCLARNPWPGNVRELANLLERLAILYPEQSIAAADLPDRYRTTSAAGWFGSGVRVAPAVTPLMLDELLDAGESVVSRPADASAPDGCARDADAASDAGEDVDLVVTAELNGFELPRGGIDLKDHLSAIELGLIRQALEEADGTIAEAARLLRMRRTTLVEKLRKYRLSA
jgi:sigma-54 specific flagellar transcriptional regulator A